VGVEGASPGRGFTASEPWVVTGTRRSLERKSYRPRDKNAMKSSNEWSWFLYTLGGLVDLAGKLMERESDDDVFPGTCGMSYPIRPRSVSRLSGQVLKCHFNAIRFRESERASQPLARKGLIFGSDALLPSHSSMKGLIVLSVSV